MTQAPQHPPETRDTDARTGERPPPHHTAAPADAPRIERIARAYFGLCRRIAGVVSRNARQDLYPSAADTNKKR